MGHSKASSDRRRSFDQERLALAEIERRIAVQDAELESLAMGFARSPGGAAAARALADALRSLPDDAPASPPVRTFLAHPLVGTRC